MLGFTFLLETSCDKAQFGPEVHRQAPWQRGKRQKYSARGVLELPK